MFSAVCDYVTLPCSISNMYKAKRFACCFCDALLSFTFSLSRQWHWSVSREHHSCYKRTVYDCNHLKLSIREHWSSGSRKCTENYAAVAYCGDKNRQKNIHLANTLTTRSRNPICFDHWNISIWSHFMHTSNHNDPNTLYLFHVSHQIINKLSFAFMLWAMA